MVGAVISKTPNYGFNLVRYDFVGWHGIEHGNWTLVDALVNSVGSVPGNRGLWTNATLYTAGDRVIDGDDSLIYRCLVSHTSAASGTFAADRAANPSYWTVVTTVPIYRGTWTTGLSYTTQDIVKNANAYYLCIVTHVAGTFATDLAAGKWTLIFDLQPAIDAAAAAAASASAASGSASAAATSATNAGNSATAAAGSASAASGSASAASTSATNAGNSATAAAGSASAASGSATAAGTSATNAATSATNAGTSATNAANSASAAATSATNASNSAISAAQSAANAFGGSVAVSAILAAAGITAQPFFIMDAVRDEYYAAGTGFVKDAYELRDRLGGVSQITRSSTATFWNEDGVLATAPINSLRVQYDPATKVKEGFLIENEARTNLVTFSKDFSQAIWSNSTNTTFTANQAIAADGTLTATRVRETVTNGLHTVVYSNGTIAKNVMQTVSFVWEPTANRQRCRVQINAFAGDSVSADFDLATGTVSAVANNGTGTLAAAYIKKLAGTNRYRIGLSGIPSSVASTSIQSSISFSNSPSTINLSYAGDVNEGGNISDFQHELGAGMSSIITTTGSAITRAADVVVFAGGSWLPSTGPATAFTDFTVDRQRDSSTSQPFRITDGTSNNVISIREGTSIAGSDMFIVAGGSTSIDSTSATVTPFVRQRAVAALDAATWIYANNNTSVQTGGATTLPIGLNRIIIGDSSFMGIVSRILFFPQRLNNTQATALSNITWPTMRADVSIPTFADIYQTPYSNRIINGSMTFNIRFGTGNADVTSGTIYTMDRWQSGLSTTPGGTLRTTLISAVTPAGNPNRVRLTSQVADASIAAGDFYVFQQSIEGFMVADAQFGTASAKGLFLRFGVKCSLAGTYGIAVRNGAFNRTYITTFTIAASEVNVDVVRTVYIPGDVTGAWAKDNTLGMAVAFVLAAGTTFQGSVGWQAGNLFTTSAQTNFMAAGNTMELFDMAMYVDYNNRGVCPEYSPPNYYDEYYLCHRYYHVNEFHIIGYNNAGNAIGGISFWPTIMRATPSVSIGAVALATNVTGSVADQASQAACRVSVNVVATGTGLLYCTVIANAEL